MNDADRLQLTEIISQEHQKSFPSLRKDKFFEIFTADHIFKSRNLDLDIDQIKSGVIGDGGDGGVDSIYIFTNNKLVRDDTVIQSLIGQQLKIDLVIIQSKQEASFGETALKNFKDFTDNCLRFGIDFEQLPKKLYNQSLIDVVRRFHTIYKNAITQRPTLSITFYYASLGEHIDGKVSQRANLLKIRLSELFSRASCDFHFVGARRLLECFYITPSKTIELEYSKNLSWSKRGESYVCLVPLRKFYEFITDKTDILQERIFEANVRDYQGDITINTDIRTTLEAGASEEFWWLNNGITVLSSEVLPHGESLTVTDPLIVNGLQTSYEIYNHFKASSANDERTILVRVIQSNDTNSIDNIIKATNSQTKIPSFLLHATENIHRKIEIALKQVGLFYDRRKNYYRNQGESAGQIVTMSYLSQALVALVLHRPDDARARPTTAAERHYSKVYADKHPKELYVKSVQILKRVEEYLDQIDIDRSIKLNVLFYVAWFATCLAMRSGKPRLKTIATLDIGRLSDSVLNSSYTQVIEIYKKHGADDTAAKGPKMLEDLQIELTNRFGRKPKSSPL